MGSMPLTDVQRVTRNERKRRTTRIAVRTLLVAGAILLALYLCPGRSELQRTRADGNVLVAALLSHRQVAGRFPWSLDKILATTKSLRSEARDWGYQPNDEGQSFYLTTGNYARDGWTLSFSSEALDWSLDH